MDKMPTQKTEGGVGQIFLTKYGAPLDRVSPPAEDIAKRIDEIPEPYRQYLIAYLTSQRTLQSIGQEMGLTGERVRQILFKIMRHIARSFFEGGEDSMVTMKSWLNNRIESREI